jgi:putative heme degradation protein
VTDIESAFYKLRQNTHPQAWDDFVREFATYTYEVTVKVTEAPAEHVLNMQGRAVQVRAMLKAITDAGQPVANRQPTMTPIQR